MSPQDFINQNINQQIDLDGYPADQPFQCYDLANKYSLSRGYGRFGGEGAKDIFGQQPGNYTWVANSPDGVPPLGSVVVFDATPSNPYGHVAIATGAGDTNNFQTIDQNWNAPRVTMNWHNYNFPRVIGWGIPKNLQTNQGGDEVVDKEIADRVYDIAFDRAADPAGLQSFVGIDIKKFLKEIELSGELSARRQAVRDLQNQNADLQKQVKALADQVKNSGGTVPQSTLDQISETNNIVKQIWQKITSIFK